MLLLLQTGIPSNVATPLGIAVAVTGAFSLIVAVSTLVKAVVEFRLQNSLRRFEKYQEINKIYKEDDTLTALRDALSEGGKALANYDALEKLKFMSFYQDIAMMCQSGLMRIEVAAYLFGFDLREASNNAEFSANLGDIHNDPNWTLFWTFCDRVNALGSDKSAPGHTDLLIRNLRF